MSITPNSIVTPQTPLSGAAKMTLANTNYDVPTQAVQVIAAQTNGARLTKVTALALATNTATEIQLYAYNGTTYRFIDSALMAAYTVAQTTKQPKTDFGISDANPLILMPNEQLCAAIGIANATGIVLRAEGAAY